MKTLNITSTMLGGVAAFALFFISSCVQAACPDFAGDDPVANSVALRKFLLDAYSGSEKKVVIPPGEYLLASLPNDPACIFLKGFKDFEIDASGVTFIIRGKAQSLRLEQCSNVALLGATFRHEIPPFSQGRIEQMDAGRRSFDVRIHDGYLQELDNTEYFFRDGSPKLINLYDPKSRELKARLDDIFFERLEKLGPGFFRFTFDKPLSAKFPISVGDLACWRGAVMPDVFFIECERLHITEVTVQNGSGFSFYEAGGNGDNVYQKCRIMRGPAPKGATESPLFSANADGFHSVSVRRGPTLEDCQFEHMNDDCIAIHGVAYLVLEAKGNAIIAAAAPQSHPYYDEVGDTVHFYDEHGGSAGEAKIQAIARLANYKLQRDLSKFDQFEIERKAGTLAFTKILLDREIPARFPWFAVNANTQGSGFVVRNCSVGFNRPRGMLIQAGEGIIEGCKVEGSAIGGIIVQPDMTYWAEGDYARNLIIRNNVIRNVGIWAQIGALNVSCYLHDGRFAPSGHQNITITGNTFEDNNGLNILISSASGVFIEKNQFIKPAQEQMPAPFGAPDGALGWITCSENVSVGENAITDPGAFMKSEISVSSERKDAMKNP